VGFISNRSGNGIDLIFRDPKRGGKIVFVEVKSSQTSTERSLSKLQADLGPKAYFTNQLNRCANKNLGKVGARSLSSNTANQIKN